MPKVSPPTSIQKFQGRKDWPLKDGLDDWGLTPEQQESYVELFRRILDARKAWREDEHDYFTLRRFLRARSYDLEKATTMWINHLQWQKDFQVETILTDFDFKERGAFVAAYPQGYHKTDKVGRPVYIQQIGKIDVVKLKQICSEERMIKFHIQEYERCRKIILPICSRLAGEYLDQTFGIMDVSGVGLSHLTGEVKRLMGLVTKYDQDNYPEMLGHICIINAPAVFRMIWSFAKGLIDPRTQSKIEILGTNYKEAVLKWVDEDNLPQWLGGKSPGSLLDDIGPWSDAELCSKIGVSVDELRAGHKLSALPGSARSSNTAGMMARRTTPTHAQAAAAASAGPAGSLGRAESIASDGFASPAGSGVDLGSRRFSGVPELVVAETMRRYAASQPSASSGSHEQLWNGGSGGDGQAGAAAGDTHADRAGTPGQPLTLMDRVVALERVLPESARQARRATAGGGENGVSGGRSTRSAAEGSLLHRVEVLEEAVEVLLSAQDASAALQQQIQQQQQQQQQLQRQQQQAAGSGCCIIM